MKLLSMLLLAILPLAASAAPSAVSTFHSIGLYWSPAGRRRIQRRARRIPQAGQRRRVAPGPRPVVRRAQRRIPRQPGRAGAGDGVRGEAHALLRCVRNHPGPNLEREISHPENRPRPARRTTGHQARGFGQRQRGLRAVHGAARAERDRGQRQGRQLRAHPPGRAPRHRARPGAEGLQAVRRADPAPGRRHPERCADARHRHRGQRDHGLGRFREREEGRAPGRQRRRGPLRLLPGDRRRAAARPHHRPGQPHARPAPWREPLALDGPRPQASVRAARA